MRSGFALIELLTALAVAAILAAIAVPRLVALTDAAAVREELLRVVAALDAARGAAIRTGAVATLELSDTSYRVVAIVDPDTIVAWRQPGPHRHRVALAGAGTPIDFGPDGLATGVANRTISLSRGGAVRRAVLSRLGRATY